MADNTVLSAAIGTGDTIRSDDIAGVKIPTSKITIGADGTDDGFISSANPLPVLLRSEQVDDAAFTPATSRVLMFGAQLDNTGTDSVDEGDGGALRMSANRCLYVNIRDNAGNERGLNIDGSGQLAVTGTFWQATQPVSVVSVPSHDVTNAGTFAVQATISGTVTVGSHAVTNAGTFAVQVDGSALTALQTIASAIYAEDVASANADKGIMVLAKEAATNAGTVGTDGDYGPLQMKSGALWTRLANSSVAVTQGTGASGSPDIWTVGTNGYPFAVQVDAALPAGTNNIGDVDVLTVPADPFGVNADAASATGSISAKLRFIASTGIPITGTVTVGSHAVTNAGTFVVQENGAALTSLQLIDDVIVADDAAFTPATTKVAMAGFRFDDVAPDSVNEGDAGAARMSANRNIYTTIRDAAGNERGLNIDASGQLAATVTNATATNLKAEVIGTGTFVVQENGAALTSLQLIDDIVYTDDTSTHATGTSKGALFMAAATPTDGSVNANDIGAVAMTVDRKLHVSVQDALPAGTNGIGKLTANSGVTIGAVEIAAAQTLGTVTTVTTCSTVTTVSAITGGSTAHDGAAAAINPLLVGAYASAAAPSDVSADNDSVRLWALRSGALASQPTYAGVLAVAGNGASGTGVQRVTIANDSTGILAGVTTVTTLTGGGVAHDSADSGNPHKIGARAALTLSDDTIVANADRTDCVSDGDGTLITRPQFPLADLVSERVTDTAGTSAAFTNFGATANTRNVVTAIVLWNSSATAGFVDFRDGTAGSVLFTVPIPAGGGCVLPAGATPYFKTTANTALAYDVSGALSTVYISISGFRSKVV